MAWECSEYNAPLIAIALQKNGKLVSYPMIKVPWNDRSDLLCTTKNCVMKPLKLQNLFCGGSESCPPDRLTAHEERKLTAIQKSDMASPRTNWCRKVRTCLNNCEVEWSWKGSWSYRLSWWYVASSRWSWYWMHLEDIQYETVVAILYVSYCPAQIPSNMVCLIGPFFS